jgi:3-isopropylmalate dehydrogenase
VERGGSLLREQVRWIDAIASGSYEPRARAGLCTIAVLPGEGVGPEVIDVALRLLPIVTEAGGPAFDVRVGGAIGRDAELLTGRALSEQVTVFCASAFDDGGAVLAGPGGGRFVYELRRHFDLFCKISPVSVPEAFAQAGRLRPEAVRGVDILIVRENAGGIYFADARETALPEDGRVCELSFRYSEREVRRIAEAGAALASRRRGHLAVIVKDGGLPALTALWRDVAGDVAARTGVEVAFLNVDLAAYQLVQEPRRFDVVVADNLYGDVLADVGAVLLGSRGMAYSGNFAASGAAVYQTNHGGAADIAGTGRANPIGQILSLAMMLRESFNLRREASWIERGVEETLRLGFRTCDMATEGTTLVGTREMGEGVAAAVERIARSAQE